MPIRSTVRAFWDARANSGSLEVGKSADFVILDRDILALGDRGKADDIAGTRVLETWFRGARVYRAGERKSS